MRDREHDAKTKRKRSGAWLALALLPMLTGCLGVAVIPILASGPLLGKKHVRAATKVPKPARAAPLPTTQAALAGVAAKPGTAEILPSADGLPAPGGLAAPGGQPAPVAGDDRWQRFFAYAMTHYQPKEGDKASLESALLAQPPAFDKPVRSECPEQQPAVIVDLDDGADSVVPARLAHAPVGVAVGLAQLRQAGIVVLWISQLPASRAADVAQALQTSGLDPHRLDQLLLIRSSEDRKQLLRENAGDDVCVIAIAGDTRGDFDELFDYLRVPGSAVGLYPMMGNGWFLVPSLDTPAAGVP